MVGGKREKDEFTLFKEQARSIKGRHEAVKDKGLNIVTLQWRVGLGRRMALGVLSSPW
jgi:hypothetical protein